MLKEKGNKRNDDAYKQYMWQVKYVNSKRDSALRLA